MVEDPVRHSRSIVRPRLELHHLVVGHGTTVSPGQRIDGEANLGIDLGGRPGADRIGVQFASPGQD